MRVEPRLSESVEVMARAHANYYEFEGLYTFRERENVENLRGTWFGGEARVALHPIPELKITAGGEGQIHPEATLHAFAVDRDGTSVYLDEQSPYRFAAGYGLVEASPLPWLRASGGARVDVYSTFGPIVVPRAALVFNFARLSAPAAASRRLNGGVLKVMGGRAFRAPSIYEQSYNDNGLSQVPAVDEARGLTLGPESVYSGEVEYSHRFLDDWVALGAGHASYVEGIINTVPNAPGSALVRYANSEVPVLVAGGDVEVRRDFRGGWMLAAMYGFQEARFLDSGEENPRLVNAPQHLASLRGVAPVVAELASLALRLTLEAPRRISVNSEEETPLALVADATISGALRDYGLRYTVGVYNISDRRYEVPVTETLSWGRRCRRMGRTFLVNLLGTYPEGLGGEPAGACSIFPIGAPSHPDTIEHHAAHVVHRAMSASGSPSTRRRSASLPARCSPAGPRPGRTGHSPGCRRRSACMGVRPLSTRAPARAGKPSPGARAAPRRGSRRRSSPPPRRRGRRTHIILRERAHMEQRTSRGALGAARRLARRGHVKNVTGGWRAALAPGLRAGAADSLLQSW